ncbi:2OG-Fe(II) oxygenase [Micromonospora sp. DT233]|uniref:2OG-Fe(II) oxygenase n=1 Tax=Micromonospora sp. DT233 TaxID=3393432 RepID=UPI003CF1EBC5
MTTTPQSPVTTDRLLRQCATFVRPEHLYPQALEELADWYHSEPSRPLVIRNFLKDRWALGVADAMRDIDVWSRCATTYHGTQGSAEITDEEWPDHPDRAARHFVARPLTRVFEPGHSLSEAQRAVLEQFLAFAVVSGPLRSWLSAGTGVSLTSRTSVEFASYQAGDEIRPHQDLLPGRVMAVNFYLDEAYQPGTGGRLGYRNERGQEFHVDPLFNSFSIIPIREECWHWVEPFRGAGQGRYTVSIGEHRADD